jgi:NitT/TauT family transport system substrate-binding protein
MTWNMVTTQELSQKYPESIKKILRAVIRANRFIAESPDETHAVSSKNIGTSGPLFENEWENYRFTVLLDQSLILNLEDQARWMIKKEAGGTRKAPNMMNIIYADALKAVQPQAVRIIGK